ncbi:hypothetical protein SprV_0200870400 [Sparganum proliferum]
MKTGIAHRTAAKTEMAARKSQAPPIRNIATQTHPVCLLRQRKFCARIGLAGHLWTQRTNRPTITIAASTTAAAQTSTSTSSASTLTNVALHPRAALPSITNTFITSATITAATTNMTISTTTATDQNKHLHHYYPQLSYIDQVPTCSYCDRTFTSHIGLVGQQ